MPITYDIDPVRGVVRTSCTGPVPVSEVLAHFDEPQRDPRRPAHLDVMLDLRGLSTPPNSPQLRSVANRIGRVAGFRFGRCAIVVDSDLIFGLARIFEAFARDHFEEIQVFRDADAAEGWLARAAEHSDESDT